MPWGREGEKGRRSYKNDTSRLAWERPRVFPGGTDGGGWRERKEGGLGLPAEAAAHVTQAQISGSKGLDGLLIAVSKSQILIHLSLFFVLLLFCINLLSGLFFPPVLTFIDHIYSLHNLNILLDLYSYVEIMNRKFFKQSQRAFVASI